MNTDEKMPPTDTGRGQGHAGASEEIAIYLGVMLFNCAVAVLLALWIGP